MSKNASPFITELKRATKGLMFQSESDYPVEPFSMPGKGREKISAQEILQAEHLPAESTVKELSVDDFFSTVTQEQEWQEAEGRRRVERFRKLVGLLKENLSDIKVYRIGDVEAVVYVVGRTGSGDFAGVTARVVET